MKTHLQYWSFFALSAGMSRYMAHSSCHRTLVCSSRPHSLILSYPPVIHILLPRYSHTWVGSFSSPSSSSLAGLFSHPPVPFGRTTRKSFCFRRDARKSRESERGEKNSTGEAEMFPLSPVPLFDQFNYRETEEGRVILMPNDGFDLEGKRGSRVSVSWASETVCSLLSRKFSCITVRGLPLRPFFPRERCGVQSLHSLSPLQGSKKMLPS